MELQEKVDRTYTTGVSSHPRCPFLTKTNMQKTLSILLRQQESRSKTAISTQAENCPPGVRAATVSSATLH